MRRAFLVLLLGWTFLAVAKDDPNEIVSQKDVPLQTMWFQPRKSVSVETKGWAFWRSSWSVYPVIGQRLDESKKWMTVVIVGHTTNQGLRPCGLVINADGKELINRAVAFSESKSIWGTLQLTADLAEVDHLAMARALASSKETWLTILTCDGSTPNRPSIRLSEQQSSAFRNSILKYDELKPKLDSPSGRE